MNTTLAINPTLSSPVPISIAREKVQDVASHSENPLNIGELIHPGYDTFCKWAHKYILPTAKAGWGLYLPLQIIGLVNENVNKLARTWYGLFWSVVYSCYRPWAPNRRTLEGEKASPKIKKLYTTNEYFRVVMGNIVSAVYGGGALGMLWGWLNGDDDFFDKAAEVYKTGMLNQNQIFGSMNATIAIRRNYNPTQLYPVDQEEHNYKAKIELVDSVLFIPNIITRAIDTFRLFGVELGEGVKRIVNSLGYFSYGTWATRYGLMKNSEMKGGDLKKVKSNSLSENGIKIDQVLHASQKTGSDLFYTVLPGLSWISAFAELCGFRELAEKAFKLEGICERINPTIAAWALRDTWFDWLYNIHSKDQ